MYGLRLKANGHIIKRTTSLPNDTSVTMCCWFRTEVDRPGNYRNICQINNSTGNTIDMTYDGVTNNFYIYNGTGQTYFSKNPPLTGEWVFAAMTCSGTTSGSVKGYWATLREPSFYTASSTTTRTALTETGIAFGNFPFSTIHYLNGDFACMRVWKKVLTKEQLYLEMNSRVAVEKHLLDTDRAGKGDLSNKGVGGVWTDTVAHAGRMPLSDISRHVSVINLIGRAVITSVVPTVLYEGLTGIAVNGSGFGDTQGDRKIYLDGAEQTITSWSKNSIVIDAVSPTLWASTRVLEIRET